MRTYELTKLVHGEEEAEKAKDAAKALFAGGGNTADMPTTTLTDAELTDGAITVIDMMVAGKLCGSKGEARRLIQGGGVFVGDEKVADFDKKVTAEELAGDGVILRKGKKTYHRFNKA